MEKSQSRSADERCPAVGNERMLLSERLSEVVDAVDAVMEDEGTPALQKARESLDFVCRTLRELPSDQ